MLSWYLKELEKTKCFLKGMRYANQGRFDGYSDDLDEEFNRLKYVQEELIIQLDETRKSEK